MSELVRLTRRQFGAATAAAVTAAGAALVAAPAGATLVFDPKRFHEMRHQLREMANVYTQLQLSVNTLRNASRSLVRTPDLSTPLWTLQRLGGDVATIGYSLEGINRQFERVFPDREAIQNTTAADAELMAQGWDHEIHQSSLVAARAQSNVQQLRGSAEQRRALLASAQSTADGDEGSQLATLQALVELLAVVNRDLMQLGQTLAATERVNAAVVGAEVGEQELSAKRQREALEGYVPSRRDVPAVDARFMGRQP